MDTKETLITRNRLFNLPNGYQGKEKRVLCVCSAGMLRSPTAAWILGNDPWNFNTRSCGTEDYALIPLDHGLILWADDVIVMDPFHEHKVKIMIRELKDNMGIESKTNVHLINVPDNFSRRDPELVKIMTDKFLKVFPINDSLHL